jgi:hypothetical protein
MYYIKYLDMFRAIPRSSSGGQNCIFTASGIVARPYSAPVEGGLTESDDTRCCKKYNFEILKMSVVLLETCRGI